MNKNLVMFSPARIALQLEVSNHPLLVNMLLSMEEGADWLQQLATICTYCNVVVDGYYHPLELDNLYNVLFFKLQSMRSIILQ